MVKNSTSTSKINKPPSQMDQGHHPCLMHHHLAYCGKCLAPVAMTKYHAPQLFDTILGRCWQGKGGSSNIIGIVASGNGSPKRWEATFWEYCYFLCLGRYWLTCFLYYYFLAKQLSSILFLKLDCMNWVQDSHCKQDLGKLISIILYYHSVIMHWGW